MDKIRIISITAVTGIVAVGLYFAFRRSFGETNEPLDDDIPLVSSLPGTETSSENSLKNQRLMAVNTVIKEFAKWKITTFDIKTYSSTVSLATDPKTTDLQVIHSVCTEGKPCNLEDGLLYTLNEAAVDLLAYYVRHNEKKHLDTAERLVKIIFGNKLKDYDPTRTKLFNLPTLINNIAILPILFEYIADSTYDNTRNMCHEFISKVLPNFHAFDKTTFNSEILMFNSIRMLSNNLFNTWNFNEDSADKNIQILIDSAVQSGLKSYRIIDYDSTLRGRLYKALMTGNH
ncbi:GSCOCT00014165001.2-RA-CDS [Cotesia congregata]|uniref:Cc_odve66_30 n=1 Tax=Cotesia congregata TaxID=51543 RepID=A0A8J2MKY4_COTCN|nr:GSCOCT00014165001.2-RA-CDS [Cotesia congregata]CAG5083109.1 Cc_odve66_30 [Cotesia congregata]